MTHHLTATASSIQPAAARRSYLVAAYRAARSTAMWFAGLLGNDGLVCHGGVVVQGTTRRETWEHSMYWLEQLRALFATHQSVLAALVQCTTTNGDNATYAAGADSRRGIDCICPECTLQALLARRAEAER